MLGVRLSALAVPLVGLLVLLAPDAASQPFILGYYVPYDPTSFASLQAHLDRLDLVAAQWVSIDGCGNLTSHDDQTLKQIAHDSGLKVEPSLLTLSASLNHQILTDDETSTNAIQQIVAYTVEEGYAGFDLDLEGVAPDDRDALSDFVGRLAPPLHDQGKLLSLAIPAKVRDVTTGWAGAYDYAALGAHADLLTIMAYEYRGPFSGPGSVAPYDWVQHVADFATSQIAPERVLLGVAFYGYDWNTSTGGARSLSYAQAVTIADYYNAEVAFEPVQQSLTFSYTTDPVDSPPVNPQLPPLAHAITIHQAPPCAFEVPNPAPPPAPRPVPHPDAPQSHAVWLEDSTSVAARLTLADRFHIRGVATWRLGLEDPQVWPLFARWRS